jgi:hypothetical protein
MFGIDIYIFILLVTKKTTMEKTTGVRFYLIHAAQSRPFLLLPSSNCLITTTFRVVCQPRLCVSKEIAAVVVVGGKWW